MEPIDPDTRPQLALARWRRQLVAFGCAFLAVAGYLVWYTLAASSSPVVMATERAPSMAWAACNRNAHNRNASTYAPLPDAKAASLVTPQPEDRSFNDRPYTLHRVRYTAPNFYVPSTSQLRRFRASRTSARQPVVQFNPYFRYVDGHDDLRNPSTDDLIQWAAHKWGIPEDWLRAEFVQESYWNQFQLGDQASASPRGYRLYPSQARVPGSYDVYESLGLTQVKWIPDGSVGAGTEPLRWESTAFNLDYQAATVRSYYDNPAGARSSWGDRSYVPCDAWKSIGGWFEPYPWGNSGQQIYIGEVRQRLAGRDWTTSDFVHWTPSSLPPGINLK